MATPTDAAIYDRLTQGRPSPREARNGLRHIVALSLSKVADGLVDPKLVLSWLATALGAPAAVTGLLVPIREAGALLPQIALAQRVRRMRHRKWAWVGGSAGQALAAAVIVAIALGLQGAVAGWVLCGALAVLAVSRAACSVSYKDVQGKTVARTRRGTVTGLAGSVASAAVLGFALLLILGGLRDIGPVAGAIGLAAVLWALAALVFATLREDASDVQEHTPLELSLLWRDAAFRRFVLVRGLLTVTALAPPYFVMLGDGPPALSALGGLVLASAAAALVSSYVWGRLADRSARLVIAVAGAGGALFAVLAVLAAWMGWTATGWVVPLLLFGFMIAYHGVRQGRSTYLVDMAPADKRAAYAAQANTAIGALLLVTGAAGGALALIGPMAALGGFAALALIGATLALRLPEAEQVQGAI